MSLVSAANLSLILSVELNGVVSLVSLSVQGSSGHRSVAHLVALQQMFKGQSRCMCVQPACVRWTYDGAGQQQLTTAGHIDWRDGLVTYVSGQGGDERWTETKEIGSRF